MSQVIHEMMCGCVYSIDVSYNWVDGVSDVEDICIEAYCVKHDPRQLRTLREALKPLAVVADVFDDIQHVDGSDGIWSGTTREGERVKVTIKQCRDARQLLKETENL